MMAHSHWGLSRSSWYRAEGRQGDNELRGTELVPDADPRDVRWVHFHVDYL